MEPSGGAYKAVVAAQSEGGLLESDGHIDRKRWVNLCINTCLTAHAALPTASDPTQK